VGPRRGKRTEPAPGRNVAWQVRALNRTKQPVHLLIVDGGNGLPAGVQALLERQDVRATRVQPDQPPDEALLQDIDAAVILPDGAGRDNGRLREWLGGLASRQIGSVLVGEEPSVPPDAGFVQSVSGLVSPDELWGRISAIACYGPTLREVSSQLACAERLEQRLNRHLAEFDQEMRLASRLQQDFLPRKFPEIGPARFAAIYRPASWVSGDIYDVFPLGETHVGFYVADAVGHGMAAGLLTIFVKRTIADAALGAKDGDIAPPGQVIAELNESLAAQDLPNSQFVTACYCVLNTRTLTLAYARGGHPYPIHIDENGTIQELKSPGAVMGVFAGQTFPTETIRLAPGQKVLLFSDGLEAAFVEQRDGPDREPKYRKHLEAVASLPGPVMCRWLSDALDAAEGSLNPSDDVTLVVLEIVK